MKTEKGNCRMFKFILYGNDIIETTIYNFLSKEIEKEKTDRGDPNSINSIIKKKKSKSQA